jgi:hypothetical protein
MKCFLNFDTRTLAQELRSGSEKNYLFAILKDDGDEIEVVELVDDYHEAQLPGEIRKVKMSSYQITRLSRGHGTRIVLTDYNTVQIKNA